MASVLICRGARIKAVERYRLEGELAVEPWAMEEDHGKVAGMPGLVPGFERI